MSILNKYKRWKHNLFIDKSRYYDFVLSLDNSKSIPVDGRLTTRCLSSYIDTNDSGCVAYDNTLISKSEFTYDLSVNDNVLLKNINLTGIDNGTILIDGGIHDNDTLLKILNGNAITTDLGGKRLLLKTVGGNTNKITYDLILTGDTKDTYYSLGGGFFQGFYKVSGYEYQVLPQYIQNAWNLEFVIRPKSGEIETSGTTLNDLYPNNRGIFFYIGTRAENKFTQFYGCDFKDFKNRSGVEFNKTPEYTVVTSENHVADDDNFIDIRTDNKYLFFNRTCSGYTTDNWVSGSTIQIIDTHIEHNENLYLLMNRTCSGYTTDNIDEYLSTVSKSSKCDLKKDLINNAFALKIDERGRVGYRYLIKDCDTELGYKIVEEYTKDEILEIDKWNDINVLLKIKNGITDDCGVPLGERRMVIYIYVNGYLKLVSKELPELTIRNLNDYYDKQEGVPYNISIGGGTQGLIESIWFDNFSGSSKVFPIEENFAGSFIGDIKSFKFYDCQLQYNEIKNNYLYEMNGKVQESKIKDNLIYFGFGFSEVDVVESGDTTKYSTTNYLRLTSVSSENEQCFYYIVSTKYMGSIAQEFTCGGAPMVMSKKEVVIDGKKCYVFKSSAKYPNNTELSIIVNQIH